MYISLLNVKYHWDVMQRRVHKSYFSVHISITDIIILLNIYSYSYYL